MTVLLGKLLLWAGCFSWGLSRALALKRRERCLDEFRRLLSAIQRELTFSLRPLPEFIATWESQGETAAFLTTCLTIFDQTGRESWCDSWAKALAETPLPLPPSDKALLQEAGLILGRYDSQSQHQALTTLLAHLEDTRREAGQETNRLFRVYLSLGAAGGVFCGVVV